MCRSWVNLVGVGGEGANTAAPPRNEKSNKLTTTLKNVLGMILLSPPKLQVLDRTMGGKAILYQDLVSSPDPPSTLQGEKGSDEYSTTFLYLLKFWQHNLIG